MQELCANADREGVTIGLEVVNRYESNVINTTSARRFVLDHLAAATA